MIKKNTEFLLESLCSLARYPLIRVTNKHVQVKGLLKMSYNKAVKQFP